VIAVVAGALALRGAALARDPGLSDDLDRYVWEGSLVAHGISPYGHAPSSPERAQERERWPEVYRGLNHPEVSAAYPPLALQTFAVLAACARDPAQDGGRSARRALRRFAAVCDLLVLAPLAWILRRRGRSPALLLVWGWCPLVALELGGVGHFDGLAILLLLTALALLERGRQDALSGLALGAATCTKLLPILAVPFALRRAEQRAAFVLGFGLACAACVAPLFLLAGGLAGLGSGLAEYAFRWEAFSLVHRWVEAPLRGFFALDESASDPRRLARIVGLTLALLMAAHAWRRQRDALACTGTMVAAFLVLTPTLHPWYLAWIVPFLSLQPSPALTWLVVAAALLYAPLPHFRASGAWHEPAWLWPAVALPFFLLLAVDLPRGWAAQRARA
jgi:hypothetical protein